MAFVGNTFNTVATGRGGGCNPCVACVLGIVLVFLSALALWGNEFDSVTTHASLMEAERLAIEVPSNSKLEGLGGRLVAIQGTLKATSPGGGADNDPSELRDDALGVTAHGVKLKRDAEMFQWYKTTYTRNDAEEVEYTLAWSNMLQKNTDGAHRNPSVMPFTPKLFEADTLQVGSFTIPQELDDKVDWFEEVQLEIDSGKAGSTRTKSKAGTDIVAVHENTAVAAVETATLPKRYHISGEHAIVTAPEGSFEEVGDMKITYSLVPEGPVSILAETTGTGKLKTWMPKKVPHSEGVAIIVPGTYTAAELIAYQTLQADSRTMGMRAGGILFAIVGWYLMLSPIEWVASFIPIFGGCASALVGCGLCAVAFALGLSISLSIISLAWIYYRPLYAVPMLCLCITIAFYAIQPMLRGRAARNRAGQNMRPPSTGSYVPVQMQRAY